MRSIALLAALATVLAACTSASPGPSEPTGPSPSMPPPSPRMETDRPSPSPTTSPSAEPTSEASRPPDDGPVIVTFLVADVEEFRVLLTEPDDIAVVRAWEAGEFSRLIPNGRIVRGDDGGVNTGWSWHLDPEDIEFGEGSIEICDGLPSHVEDGTVSGPRYCTWSAELVSIEPAG